MKKGLIIMTDRFVDSVYSEETREEISRHIELLAAPLTAEECVEYPDLLEQTEVIFSGWGAPVFDALFLEKAPNLEAIFYAGGTMKRLLTDDVWDRGIRVTTANVANAIPVAEYTLSQIVFSLKNGWQITRQVRKDRQYQFGQYHSLGTYKRTVGLISLSQVGRKTLELLGPYDLEVVCYDPFVSEAEAEKLGVEKVSLEELFAVSDVASLHSPLLPETTGMITGDLLRSMKPNTTFINTARGAIVKEEELTEVMQERPDLTAILDVTHPEPPAADSPLFDLDNVVVTPHIAGSAGSETERLGAFMLEEAKRYVNGEPLEYSITKESYARMA